MMPGSARARVAAVAVAALAGCSAGDNRVDPGDLELRDLLGVSPDTARGWDAAARAAARRVLASGLHTPGAGSLAATAEPRTASLDDRIAAALASGDARRAAAGIAALGMVRVAVTADGVAITGSPAGSAAAAIDPGPLAPNAPRTAASPEPAIDPGQLAPAAARAPRTAASPEPAIDARAGRRATRSAIELWLAEPWDHGLGGADLAARGRVVLSALATDAGQLDGAVIVVPAARLPVIAAYVAAGSGEPLPRLLVNPVLLAALEPDIADPVAISIASHDLAGPPTAPLAPHHAPPLEPASFADGAGNPYSFYGSVAECATAQRTRCATCLGGGTCTPITDAADGTTECTALDGDAGRGYFLLCINLALAITSVNRCTGAAAPACARDDHASDSLDTLDDNATFLADAACANALDGCLAEIYGAPRGSFPGPDGGPEPADPPRSTDVSCSNACDSHDNSNCESSPSCNGSGPSCNNSLSCDSECSSSNDQHGCGGNCNACTSSGGGGSCGKDSSSCGGSGDGGGCSSGSGSGGGCSSGSGGGCSSGSGGGCSSGGGCNNSGGGSTKCSAAPGDPVPGLGLAMSVLWGVLPVPVAAMARRRARRRLATPRTTHPADAPPTTDAAHAPPTADAAHAPPTTRSIDTPPTADAAGCTGAPGAIDARANPALVDEPAPSDTP